MLSGERSGVSFSLVLQDIKEKIIQVSKLMPNNGRVISFSFFHQLLVDQVSCDTADIIISTGIFKIYPERSDAGSRKCEYPFTSHTGSRNFSHRFILIEQDNIEPADALPEMY